MRDSCRALQVYGRRRRPGLTVACPCCHGLHLQRLHGSHKAGQIGTLGRCPRHPRVLPSSSLERPEMQPSLEASHSASCGWRRRDWGTSASMIHKVWLHGMPG